MNIRECAELLRAHDDFLVVTHRRPDGDTLGGAAALCCGLRTIGKRAYVFEDPKVTETYLPFVEPYFAPADFQPAYVVAIDVATEHMFSKGFAGSVDMAIDHHPSNSGYATHSIIRPEKAACGEIVMEVLKELCGTLSPEMASLLYIAVSTDTGCFGYSNTTADAHRVAAELIDAGAELEKLNKLLFRTVSAARLQLEGLIYSNLRRFREGQINIALVTLEMMEKVGATEDDCDDLASLPGKIAGNKISATIRELTPGFCKVSVRSGREVDSSAVCAMFGGGGHKMAAGCELNASPEEAVEKIVYAINEVWK